MKIIGITGSIGTGKSTVLELLKQQGYPTISADKISKDVFNEHKEKIINYFGTQILENDNTINRKKVAAIIFNDKIKKRYLENIIHPKVFFRLFLFVLFNFLKGERLVFMEIPLFFEHNYDYFIDSLVVYCSEDVQKQRLASRDGTALMEEKIKAQMPLEIKLSKATYKINNNGDIFSLKKGLEEMDFGGTSLFVHLFLIISFILLLKVD